MNNNSKNILKEKSYNFSLRIIKLYKYLSEKKKEFIISKQILRSWTSVWAMIREWEYAQSKMDSIYSDYEEIIKLLISSIKTTKNNISK